MDKIVDKISFVKFNRDFLQKSYFWLSNPEIRRLTDTPSISRDGQEQWFRSLSSKKDYYIKGILADNYPIGAVGIKNITAVQGEYWGYIGEKSYWGKGVGKAMVEEMVHVAKRDFNLKILYLKVVVDNIRALSLYKRIGFIINNSDERFNYMTYQLNV